MSWWPLFYNKPKNKHCSNRSQSAYIVWIIGSGELCLCLCESVTVTYWHMLFSKTQSVSGWLCHIRAEHVCGWMELYWASLLCTGSSRVSAGVFFFFHFSSCLWFSCVLLSNGLACLHDTRNSLCLWAHFSVAHTVSPLKLDWKSHTDTRLLLMYW